MNKEMIFYKIKIKSNKFKMFSLQIMFLRMKKIKNKTLQQHKI